MNLQANVIVLFNDIENSEEATEVRHTIAAWLMHGDGRVRKRIALIRLAKKGEVGLANG